MMMIFFLVYVQQGDTTQRVPCFVYFFSAKKKGTVAETTALLLFNSRCCWCPKSLTQLHQMMDSHDHLL